MNLQQYLETIPLTTELREQLLRVLKSNDGTQQQVFHLIHTLFDVSDKNPEEFFWKVSQLTNNDQWRMTEYIKAWLPLEVVHKAIIDKPYSNPTGYDVSLNVTAFNRIIFQRNGEYVPAVCIYHIDMPDQESVYDVLYYADASAITLKDAHINVVDLGNKTAIVDVQNGKRIFLSSHSEVRQVLRGVFISEDREWEDRIRKENEEETVEIFGFPIVVRDNLWENTNG